MMKHTIAALQAVVGTKLTGPINKIHERPTFSTLWHVHRQLAYSLHKVGNVNPPLVGHTCYILLKATFTLFSSKEWRDPEEVGEYYEIPVTAIRETKQQTGKNKWKFKK